MVQNLFLLGATEDERSCIKFSAAAFPGGLSNRLSLAAGNQKKWRNTGVWVSGCAAKFGKSLSPRARQYTYDIPSWDRGVTARPGGWADAWIGRASGFVVVR
jgi:hypothetical protein